MTYAELMNDIWTAMTSDDDRASKYSTQKDKFLASMTKPKNISDHDNATLNKIIRTLEKDYHNEPLMLKIMLTP